MNRLELKIRLYTIAIETMQILRSICPFSRISGKFLDWEFKFIFSKSYYEDKLAERCKTSLGI